MAGCHSIFAAAHCRKPSAFGKPAKLLFDGLRDEAQKEECTGSMEKSGGNGLFCHAYEDGTYLCEFGYSFKEDAFVFSAEDC